MITRNDILIAIETNNFSATDLVSIFTVLVSKLNINTFSGMAKQEGKTTDGIRKSNRYRKINIGSKTFAVKGVRNTELFL